MNTALSRQGTIRTVKPRRAVTSEATIQRAIVDWLAVCAPSVEAWAVPNSARRTASGRATNAVPGLRKGVFDLSLIFPDGRFAAIEVKNERGQLSPEQCHFRDALMKRNVPYCVARGVEDVRKFLEHHNVETREARS